MKLTLRNALMTAPALTLTTLGVPGLQQAQTQPRRGGSITVHMSGEIRILNPALRASTGVYVVAGKIMEALVDLGPKGRPPRC